MIMTFASSENLFIKPYFIMSFYFSPRRRPDAKNHRLKGPDAIPLPIRKRERRGEAKRAREEREEEARERKGDTRDEMMKKGGEMIDEARKGEGATGTVGVTTEEGEKMIGRMDGGRRGGETRGKIQVRLERDLPSEMKQEWTRARRDDAARRSEICLRVEVEAFLISF